MSEWAGEVWLLVRWAACVTLMMFWWSFIVHQGPLPHGQYMVTSMSNTQSFGLIRNITLDTLFKMANETLESSMSVCLSVWYQNLINNCRNVYTGAEAKFNFKCHCYCLGILELSSQKQNQKSFKKISKFHCTRDSQLFWFHSKTEMEPYCSPHK